MNSVSKIFWGGLQASDLLSRTFPWPSLFSSKHLVEIHPFFRKVPRDSYTLHTSFGKFRKTHTLRIVLSESSERLIHAVYLFRKVPKDSYTPHSTFGKFRETHTHCRVLSESSERPIHTAEYFRKVPKDSYMLHSTFGSSRKSKMSIKPLSESSESNKCKRITPYRRDSGIKSMSVKPSQSLARAE